MSSQNRLEPTSFLPIYRQFPVDDSHNLEKQLVNSYTQTANAVNARVLTLKGNSGDPVQNHEIKIIGGTGVSVVGDNKAKTLTISATLAGFAWNVVTSVNNTVVLVPENGYIPKGAAQVIFQLPAAANIGDTYQILGFGNLWTIQQNAGQTIYIGNHQTTTGVFGSLTATMIKDSVEIICVTPNIDFQVADMMGNPTIV